MFCRNCGNEVSDKAVLCVACGTPPRAGSKFCYNCKASTYPDATVCMKCGVAINRGRGSKDWLTTLLLAIFLGGCGVHRFYTGHIGTGIAQLFTLGGCGIWTLIDIIQIATGNFKDAKGNKLVKNNI
jgi:TM2 domain-containing membrane protein YozV/ribosomal protein L40E